MPVEPAAFSIRDTATRLGISIRGVKRHLQNGTLKRAKHSTVRKVLIPVADVEQLLHHGLPPKSTPRSRRKRV